MAHKKLPEPKAFQVYRITCLANLKCYVGVTSKTTTKRCADHFEALRNGTHRNKGLQEDFDRYGEKCFATAMLESVVTDRPHDHEAMWMVKTGSLLPKRGYNRLGFDQIEDIAKDPERSHLLDGLTREAVLHLGAWAPAKKRIPSKVQHVVR